MNHDIDIEKLKSQTSLLDLAGKDTRLKKVASTGGGEYAGPCPMPGCSCDHDGFRVQPVKNQWFCRGCGEGRWHDVIDYVMQRDGVDFKTAVDSLERGCSHPAPVKSKEPVINIDRTKHTDAALEFLEKSCEAIWTHEGDKARAWLHGRGLTDETLKLWSIGYNPKDTYPKPESWGLPSKERIWLPRGIVIPNHDDAGFHYLKIRKPVGEPKYEIVKGSRGWLFGGMTCRGNYNAFLFESELDVLLGWQTELAVGFCSIPAGNLLRSDYSPYFTTVERLIVAFDNDEQGQAGALEICKLSPTLFYKANPFPQGKDLTELYQAGGDILDWILPEIDNAYKVQP